MNDTRLNGTLLNRSVLNTTRLNATGIARKAKESVEDRVMKSLVLWYDLKKQGATNESMAADPRIIDHSGNGHHVKCRNFAWAGMSGIGGYNMDSSDWSVYSNATYSRTSATTIHITKVSPKNNDLLIAWLAESGSSQVEPGTEFTLPAIRFKVQGIADGELRAYIKSADGYSQVLANGQEYYFPGGTFESKGSNNGFEIGWVSADKTERDVDITVELLPLYPNALVSDGVDDYAEVNMTQKEDFTYIIAKDLIATPIADNQIFGTGGNGQGCVNYSFGNYWKLELFNHANNIEEYMNHIDVITPSTFNGHPIVKGDVVNERRTIRFFGYGMIRMQLAFYSFLFFDRTLTAEEIEWVKTNMIGGDEQ